MQTSPNELCTPVAEFRADTSDPVTLRPTAVFTVLTLGTPIVAFVTRLSSVGIVV